MRSRFLLDEHMNRAIQRQLRRLVRDIEILAIGDPGAPETGTPDPAILLVFAAEAELQVLTNEDKIQ